MGASHQESGAHANAWILDEQPKLCDERSEFVAADVRQHKIVDTPQLLNETLFTRT